ncbi:hypothetical protein SUGI_0898260 [Cryptomeria japonica]|nr:hypothetical protein SUGI_0898260 [Cryptomeria japonica]
MSFYMKISLYHLNLDFQIKQDHRSFAAQNCQDRAPTRFLYIVESTDINGGRGGDILVEENAGRDNGCRAKPCYCGGKFCGKDHFPDLTSGNIKTGGLNGGDRRSVAVNWNSSFGRKGKRFARSATYERFCETRTLYQPGVVS